MNDANIVCRTMYIDDAIMKGNEIGRYMSS